MDYADETYVRKYTRKTLTWKLLGWEGRAVMDAMLGEFDAAGIFAIRGDAAQCIAAVTDIPLEVVRVGLARLLETETWVVTARVITWPTYEEAQNCRRSDRLRQRESRRARSAQSVTNGHMPSRRSVTDVTAGHTESHEVTLPPSAPSAPSASPLPPLAPCAPTQERAHEPEPPSVAGLKRVAGVRGRPPRDYTMPCAEPPEDYLQQADAEFTDREQAKSTWRWYWRTGLPEYGVEKLYPWLLQQARDFKTGKTKLPRAGPGRAASDVQALIDRANAMEAQEHENRT